MLRSQRDDRIDRFVEFRKEEIEQSVPARFERQAERFADRLAVKTSDRALTYRALNQAANRVARAVLQARASGEEPVALLFKHTETMIVGLLGVLKAGKIIVPLDPSHPRPRIASLLEDSQAGLIVTDTKSLAVAEGLAGKRLSIINVDSLDHSLSVENLKLPLSPDHLMRIAYTSGSTGRPKGVMQNHRNFLHAIMRYTNAPRVSPDDRLLLLSTYSRTAGMSDIFRALLNGAGLFPFDIQGEGFTKLIEWLIQEEITIYHSVPSVFRHFVQTLSGREQFPRLRLIHLGGEPLSKRDVELYKTHFPANSVLLNNLSGTETSTCLQYFVDKSTEVTGSIVPVGYPVDDVDILLLDEAGNEVGVGQVGEIAVKSPYLALGYWRRPDLTRERFRSAPGGKRMYLTGDVGRMLPDGRLVHLGRKDSEVKIRGNRIEIAEIEMALFEHPQVKEAAVAVKHLGPDGASLVAYVVPRRAESPQSIELRAFLRRTLPEFMVPSAFVVIEVLPVLPSGKVDRRALSALGPVRPGPGTSFVPPVDAMEHQLVRIWEEVLNVRPIGLRDDFFDLGGHSLLAVRMMDRIEQVSGIKLPLATLFAGATIEHLAKEIVEQPRTEPRSLLVPIRAEGTKPPLFFLRADFLRGGGFYCLELARVLGEDQPFYALALHGHDGGPLPETVEERAAAYLQMIRTIQPEGPYFLAGFCNGGVTAFEMARQLQERGDRVARLVLIAASNKNARFAPLHALVRRIGSLFRLESATRLRLFRMVRDRVIRFEQFGQYYRIRLQRLSGLTRVDRISCSWRGLWSVCRDLAGFVVSGSHRDGPSNAGRRQQGDGDRSHVIAEGMRKAIASYLPRPYEGRVTLIWPREEPSERRDEPTAGWGRVATEVEIHEVPGGHETAITTHIGALADRLRACVQDAQESGA